MKVRIAAALFFIALVATATAWLINRRTAPPSCVAADGTRFEFIGFTRRGAHTNFVGSYWRERVRGLLPGNLKSWAGPPALRLSCKDLAEDYAAWVLVTSPTSQLSIAAMPGSFVQRLASASLSNRVAGIRRAPANITATAYPRKWWVIETMDLHGCEFRPADSHRRYAPGASYSNQTLYCFPLQVFPRRDSEMILRFYTKEGDVAKLQIPNPVPGVYPSWSPGPGVQATNHYTFEFHGWLAPHMPDLRARRDGALLPAVVPRISLADATGNSNAVTLCRRESALRVIGDCKVRELALTDMVRLRSLRIPAAGETTEIGQSFRIGTNQFVLAALCGRGNYKLQRSGLLLEGKASAPLLFLEFGPDMPPTDYAVWANDARVRPSLVKQTKTGMLCVYEIDVLTAMADVEVGPEPVIGIDMLVPPDPG